MRSGRGEQENGEMAGMQRCRNAEAAVVMLQLCHQPAPDLPQEMEALLLENEGSQLGCAPLAPCPCWMHAELWDGAGCVQEGMQEQLDAPLSCVVSKEDDQVLPDVFQSMGQRQETSASATSCNTRDGGGGDKIFARQEPPLATSRKL